MTDETAIRRLPDPAQEDVVPCPVLACPAAADIDLTNNMRDCRTQRP